jgi:hypothetical protein
VQFGEGGEMTRDELIRTLKAVQKTMKDPELAHEEADRLLLEYINDEKVTAAFAAIKKWYA